MCDCERQHSTRQGAVGLLAVQHTVDGRPYVLLQKRSRGGHGSEVWGLVHVTLDRHDNDNAVAGALRTAREKAALVTDLVRVQGLYVEDHGGGSFRTVIAQVEGLLEAAPTIAEGGDLRWMAADEVATQDLDRELADAWPRVRPALGPLVVVLDMANIIGARAEQGWWKDRAGAASRLLNEIHVLADHGIVHSPEGLPALDRWFPQITAVLEGAAVQAAAQAAGLGSQWANITVVAAPGSGDDAIVRAVRDRLPWENVVVVTADRELRRRVTSLGALVRGPRWLLDQL